MQVEGPAGRVALGLALVQEQVLQRLVCQAHQATL